MLGMHLLAVGKAYRLSARQRTEVSSWVTGTEEKLSQSYDQSLPDTGKHWQSESVVIPVEVAYGVDFRIEA